MSELDKLRELLENRGFEVSRETDLDGEAVLAYRAGECDWVAKAEAAYGHERLSVASAQVLTAWDAIRVTAGPKNRACRYERQNINGVEWYVGSCRWTTRIPPLLYCPNCGGEVVDADD